MFLVTLEKGHIGDIITSHQPYLFISSSIKAKVDNPACSRGVPRAVLCLPTLALVVVNKDRAVPKPTGDGVLHLVNLDFERLVLSALTIGKTGFNEIKLCHRSSSFQCRIL